MPNFETGNLALGLIFPYQNPVSDDRLNDWMDENNYNPIVQDSPRALNIGPSGLEVEGEEGVGKKDGLRLLYQSSANLNGFPNSSFITIKNTEQIEFDPVISDAKSIYSWLDEYIDVDEEIVSRELTIEGLLRVGRDHDLSNYYSGETFDLLESVGGSSAKGVTVQFESSAKPDSNDWYRILLDGKSAGNPNLWSMKMTLRYDDIDEIDQESVLSSIDELISHTEEE
ncbi:hypothetical protein [Natrinema limicola]|uniref:hypothetical protein n=1 Tax=Natrinema limicola TaxID=370323 RepID=UPI0012674FBA|nr:hypothetical protein [Natrinema limicola]